MRFLILGASGRTGQLTVEDALKRGHTVTALVRKASSMEARNGLTIVEGTPLEPEDIKKAFAATSSDPITCVVVALNATRTSDSPFAKPLAPPNFIEDCVRNATAVMAEHDIKRIVIMSAFGIGSSHDQLPCLTKLVFKHTNMSYQMNDHEATDADVHAQEHLDWTFVRPVMLKEGDAALVKELGEEGKGAGLLSGITRASVAAFLVKVAEDEAWAKRAVVISN
jgi:putative NADH-flavin reductase